jgi:hypothetical protein
LYGVKFIYAEVLGDKAWVVLIEPMTAKPHGMPERELLMEEKMRL